MNKLQLQAHYTKEGCRLKITCDSKVVIDGTAQMVGGHLKSTYPLIAKRKGLLSQLEAVYLQDTVEALECVLSRNLHDLWISASYRGKHAHLRMVCSGVVILKGDAWIDGDFKNNYLPLDERCGLIEKDCDYLNAVISTMEDNVMVMDD